MEDIFGVILNHTGFCPNIARINTEANRAFKHKFSHIITLVKTEEYKELIEYVVTNKIVGVLRFLVSRIDGYQWYNLVCKIDDVSCISMINPCRRVFEYIFRWDSIEIFKLITSTSLYESYNDLLNIYSSYCPNICNICEIRKIIQHV